MIGDGDVIERTAGVSVRVEPEVRDQLARLARRNGRTVSQEGRIAILAHLARERRERERERARMGELGYGGNE